MGRQIRSVPVGWQHPIDSYGNYVPLYSGFERDHRVWTSRKRNWNSGLRPVHRDDCPATYDWVPRAEWRQSDCSFEDYFGDEPDIRHYCESQPGWAQPLTHVQFYEVTTEGTPLSEVFPNTAALASSMAEHRQPLWDGKPGTFAEWMDAIDRCLDWRELPDTFGDEQSFANLHDKPGAICDLG